MSGKKNGIQERDMELFIGKWLRFGAFSAAAIALIGGIVYLCQNQDLPDYKVFTGAAMSYRHFPGIWNGLIHGDGASIIQFAAIVLIATPILRIVFSLIAFALEKDRLYVLITLIVLGVIAFGMFSGLGG